MLNKTKSKFFYLPRARSFSEIEGDMQDKDPDHNQQFDISDNGQGSEDIFEDLYGKDMFLFILSNLKTERDIILFLLQIIREEYQKFTYDELASALNIHRVRYMQELRKTKDLIKDILEDYK